MRTPQPAMTMPDRVVGCAPAFPAWLDALLDDPLHPGLLAERLDARGVTLYQPWHESLVGNPWRGQIHGGVLTVLLDKATRAAALTVMASNEGVVPLDLRVDHLAPTLGREGLRVRAACHHLTRTVAFVEATVTELNASSPVVVGTSSLLREV